MLNVCPECRDMSVEKEVHADPSSDESAIAVCPTCGHEFRFPYVSLFTLEGVPGVGKSTTAGLLDGTVPLALYEGDQFIDLVAGHLEWASICELGLRQGMTIHACGRQALYVGGIRPHDLGESPETRYFPAIHRCALVCADAELESRLRDREYLREHPDRIDYHLENNRWYRDNGPDRGIHVVDTSEPDPEEVATSVRVWIEAALEG